VNNTKDEVIIKIKSICSRKELSVFEVKEKLYAMKITELDFDEIIQELKNENFINEERFALAFTNDKYRFNKWGLKKIKYELKSRRIAEKNINMAFETIDYNEYSEMIKSEIKKKIKTIKTKDKNELKNKIFNFAQQRGYETNLISEVLRENLNNGN